VSIPINASDTTYHGYGETLQLTEKGPELYFILSTPDVINLHFLWEITLLSERSIRRATSKFHMLVAKDYRRSDDSDVRDIIIESDQPYLIKSKEW
jgi:hypothetical protein